MVRPVQTVIYYIWWLPVTLLFLFFLFKKHDAFQNSSNVNVIRGSDMPKPAEGVVPEYNIRPALNPSLDKRFSVTHSPLLPLNDTTNNPIPLPMDVC